MMTHLNLYSAVAAKDIQRVRKLLKAKKRLRWDTKNKDLAELLHVACLVNDVHVVDLLLKEQAPLNHVGANGSYPLLATISQGNHLIAEKLLKAGVNPTSDYDDIVNPLMASVSSGNPDMTRLLLQHGALVNKFVNGLPILHHSLIVCNVDTVRLLVENNADLSATCSTKSNTCLAQAASNGYLKAVQLFLEHGAVSNTLNAEHATALHLVAEGIEHFTKFVSMQRNFKVNEVPGCRNDDFEAVTKILLNAGIDPNIKDIDGNTALMLSRRPCITKCLLAVTDVNTKNSFERTALHQACGATSHVCINDIMHLNRFESAKLLIGAGVDVNAVDAAGCTALHYAIMMNDENKLVCLILQHGADCGIRLRRLVVLPPEFKSQNDPVICYENLTAYELAVRIGKTDIATIIERHVEKHAVVSPPLSKYQPCIGCGKLTKRKCRRCEVAYFCSLECMQINYNKCHKSNCHTSVK